LLAFADFFMVNAHPHKPDAHLQNVTLFAE